MGEEHLDLDQDEDEDQDLEEEEEDEFGFDEATADGGGLEDVPIGVLHSLQVCMVFDLRSATQLVCLIVFVFRLLITKCKRVRERERASA